MIKNAGGNFDHLRKNPKYSRLSPRSERQSVLAPSIPYQRTKR
jgi:hypothetical protein